MPTKPSKLRIETMKVTIDNLKVVRRTAQDMGRPMSNIRKIDDAIDAINHILDAIEGDKK